MEKIQTLPPLAGRGGTRLRDCGRDLLAAAALVVVVGVTLGQSVGVGEFWWTDEARHAMNGVYVLDVFRDLPFPDLYTYTMEYFVRYPALGLTWYPPFFPFIEAILFAVAGVSEAVAHIAVIVFAVAGMLAWYVWAHPIWGRAVAFLSGVLFLTYATVLEWGTSVVLEIPAVAMMTISLLAVQRSVQTLTHTRAILAGVAIAAMLLTKQVTGFFLPVLVLLPVVSGQWRLLLERRSLWIYAATLVALAALAAHAILLGTVAIESIRDTTRVIHLPDGTEASRWMLHLIVLEDAFGGVVLSLAIFGLLVTFAFDRRTKDLTLLVWIVLWYVAFSLASTFYGNSLRYTIYVALPISLLAVRLLAVRAMPRSARGGLVAGFVALLAWRGADAIDFAPHYIHGYRGAAEFVHALPERSGTILFCCKHDGNFVFHIKRLDTEQQEVVLRADKTLISMAVLDSFGTVSYTKTTADLYDQLDHYGVEIVVAESRDLVGRPEFKMLLEELASDAFEPLTTLDVDSDLASMDGITIGIYRYRRAKQPPGGEILLPMPHIGRELRLKLGARQVAEPGR